jgi:ubiquinol-cytochrome c reductase cytochrome c1 subunit
MKINAIKTLLAVLLLALASGPAAAAGGASNLEPSGINVNDTASLQRGAKVFLNYCLSCHEASYMRYKRLSEDLGLSEEMVMDNMIFGDAKIGDLMTIAMDPEDSARWFGKTPPNLTLIARARGADWLYGFLRSFYQDENGRWNNLLLPNAAMPHVMWSLQGIQVMRHGEGDEAGQLELQTPGLMSPEEYDDTVRDLVAYLDYMSEPAKLKRKNVGVWVMLFLAVFAFMAYLLKAEFWRDVH